MMKMYKHTFTIQNYKFQHLDSFMVPFYCWFKILHSVWKAIYFPVKDHVFTKIYSYF